MRFINPKKTPAARRERARYLFTERGSSVRIPREECGENREVLSREQLNKGITPIVLVGKFVFRRDRPVVGSRSKYAPHVGHKQRLRDPLASMALTA